MSTVLVVSSKGQIALPAAIRRRLGLGAGARVQIEEQAGVLTLRALQPVSVTQVDALSGMLKARSTGQARSLDDFDPAALAKHAVGKVRAINAGSEPPIPKRRK